MELPHLYSRNKTLIKHLGLKDKFGNTYASCEKGIKFYKLKKKFTNSLVENWDLETGSSLEEGNTNKFTI